jgi:hypothetical protein
MMTWYRQLAILMLFGCAANTPEHSQVEPQEPECSFRAPTSCWTLGARFPTPLRAVRPQPKDSLESPPLLAAKSDSVSDR